MTMRPVPASVPWFSMRARFVRTPGFSLAYQLRISFTRVPMVLSFLVAGRPRSGLPPVEVLGLRHVIGAADEDGRALVALGGADAQHPLRARARPPSRRLDEQGHRRHLVEQPELGLGLGGIGEVGWIH